MKRFFCLSLLSLLCAAPALRAEDAASVAARQELDENYKIMKGKVEDLSDANTALQKRIQSLEKEISELRAQVAKPAGNFATPDDLKHLADAIKEVDKKREADNKLVVEKISNLATVLSHGGGRVKDIKETDKGKEPAHTDDTTTVPPPDPNQPTFTYIIKDNDNYSSIALAYRKQGVKVTSRQIQDANPNIKSTQLYVGMKIQIPDTRAAGAKPDAK